jgi:biotin transport system substrate-specific component
MEHRSVAAPAAESRAAPRLLKILAVALFALLTALGARAAVPLPGTVVPVTLQTLFVLLSGALLGPASGAASQLAYLAAGMAGLPAFAAGGGPAYLFGPTGGYLLAFPAAAAAAGLIAGKGPTRGLAAFVWLAVGLFLASLIVFAGGVAQLAVLTGDPGRAIQVGVVPFLVGDVVKVCVAAAVAVRLKEKVTSALA